MTWVERPLGSVATLQRGFDLPYRDRRPGAVPIVTSAGASDTHDRAMARAPGVVTGRYGTIGQVFYLAEDFWPLNTTLWVSNFHGNDERFIYYLLQGVDYATHSGKSGVPGVNRNDLHGEVVFLPDDAREQRAIAETLADADALIASIERLLAKKRDIKQGLMQELLTGRTRLPGFSGEWRESEVAQLAMIVKGQQLGRSEMNELGSIEVWNGGVEPSGYTETPNILHEVVTISEGGNSCGWVGAPQSGFWLGGHCYALTPRSNVLPIRFLYQALKFREGDIMGLRVGSGLPNIQKRALSAFMVKVPEDALEAHRIGEILSDADVELAALDRRLVSARNIKRGMMQELLTGRTRMVSEVAA